MRPNSPDSTGYWWGQGGYGVDIMRAVGHAAFGGVDVGDIYYNGAAVLLRPLPTVAAAVELVSSSGNDDVAGTGALTCRVTGLDGNYALVTEDFIMTGAVAVVGTQLFLRILKTVVLTAGTAATNVGSIDCQGVGGGTVWDRIETEAGKSMPGALTVPANKTLWIARWAFTSNALTATVFEWKKRNYGGAWHNWLHRHTYFGGEVRADYAQGLLLRVPAKTDLRSVCDTGAAASVTSDIYGVLTDD